VPIRIYREAEARAAGLLEAPADDVDGDGEVVAATRTAPPSPGAFVRDLLTRVQQRTVRS
jgi:hypothetical protein